MTRKRLFERLGGWPLGSTAVTVRTKLGRVSSQQNRTDVQRDNVALPTD